MHAKIDPLKAYQIISRESEIICLENSNWIVKITSCLMFVSGLGNSTIPGNGDGCFSSKKNRLDATPVKERKM
jgi:hypothetical protein